MTVADRFRILLGYVDPTGKAVDHAEVDRLAGKDNPGHLGQIVGGRIVEPRLSSIKPYAAVLGCDPLWLLHGVGKAPKARDVKAAWAEAQARKAAT